MTTDILQISDTHLGKLQYRSDIRRDDFTVAFEAAINIAIEEDVDAVLHTGDLFDDANPPVSTVNECARILKKLSKEDIPLYGIVGNHERKLDSQWLDLYEQFDSVHRLGKSPVIINDEVALYGIDAIRKPYWKKYDFTLDECDEELVKIVAMHELFKPLVPEHRGDPYDIEEVISRLNIKPDAFALGDYHSQVQKSVGPNNDIMAFYPGSTERCSTDELAERAVLVLTAEPNSNPRLKTRQRTISSDPKTDAPRPFELFEFTIDENTNLSDIGEMIDERISAKDCQISEHLIAVNILGTSNLSASDIESYVKNKGAAVTHINDKRSPDVDISVDVGDDNNDSFEDILESEMEDTELSPLLQNIEGIVRENNSIPKSNIRPRVEELINEEFEDNMED